MENIGAGPSPSHPYCDDETSSSESIDSYLDNIYNTKAAVSGASPSSTVAGKCIKTSSCCARGKVRSGCLQKLPTRRPDPGVSNRNALMARENRRRKKEYVTRIEETIQKFKEENKKLRKLLKNQVHETRKLAHEKNYLKSVLRNGSQIASLIRSLRQPNRQSLALNACPSPSLFAELDYNFLEEGGLNKDGEDAQYEDWNNDRACGGVDSGLNTEYNCSSVTKGDAGICLHVCDDNLSLEFCVNCNDSGKKFWNS